MKKLTAAIIAFVVTGAAAALADAHGDRQALMRSNNAAMSAINATVLGVLDPKIIKAQVQILVDNSGKIPVLFAPGSEQNDPGALPAIWTDQAGFKAAASKLAADAKKVPSGFPDRTAMVLAMKDVQADCGGCHKAYRVPPAVDPNARGGRRGAAPVDADAAAAAAAAAQGNN